VEGFTGFSQIVGPCVTPTAVALILPPSFPSLPLHTQVHAKEGEMQDEHSRLLTALDRARVQVCV
jgi:hypothetical protein